MATGQLPSASGAHTPISCVPSPEITLEETWYGGPALPPAQPARPIPPTTVATATIVRARRADRITHLHSPGSHPETTAAPVASSSPTLLAGRSRPAARSAAVSSRTP